MVTLTSRSWSGTPDSAVSLRIFALTARADPRSAIARGCITSSTTPETCKYCHADIITAYAQYAAPTATNPQKKSLIGASRSEVHTSELQSQSNLVCRLLLEKKKKKLRSNTTSESQ